MVNQNVIDKHQLTPKQRYGSGVALGVSAALYLYSMADLASGSTLEHGLGFELAIAFSVLAGAVVGLTAKPVFYGRKYEHHQNLAAALVIGICTSFFSVFSAMFYGDNENGLAALCGAMAVIVIVAGAATAKKDGVLNLKLEI